MFFAKKKDTKINTEHAALQSTEFYVVCRDAAIKFCMLALLS